jgi:glycosyltransferase involved in cell wall biosynthesis
MGQPGVSVVICTHNGAARLEPTLEHLRRQQTPPGLRWEVLVIDNASTDSSGERARRIWSDGPAPLRVVPEPELGESNARCRGLQEAHYSIIGFVDDDNWAGPHWVEQLAQVMAEDPELGACGSVLTPAFETPPPNWFSRYQVQYGIVSPDPEHPAIAVCTAGMGLRVAAWESLIVQGFRPHLTGQIGLRRLAGWDTELCYALKLAGWKLVIDPRLTVQHHLPPARLSWKYLRALVVASAYSVPALDAYHFAWRKADRLRENWVWAFASGVKQLIVKHSLAKILISRLRLSEGDDDAITIDMQIARLKGLVSLGRRYGEIRREIRRAKWRIKDRLA